MRITATLLLEQYRRASRDWPFIDALEVHHGLPRGLLYAVGSRETNLTDEIGDGGHGHGVFQLDDRSHTIPNPFPVALQAELAATMLAGLIHTFDGNVLAAVCAYNAGAGAVSRQLRRKADPNAVTANGDYGRDVLDRCSFLQRQLTPPAAPAAVAVHQEDDDPMLIFVIDARYYLLAQGRITYIAGPADLANFEAAGAKQITVTPDEFGILTRAYGQPVT